MTTSNVTVKLDQADFRKILPQACIAIFGRRRTGKTQFAMFLTMYLAMNIPRIVCMCGNKDNMVEWQKVLHPLYIHERSLDYLANLRAYQEIRVSKSRNQWIEDGHDVDDFVVPRHLRVLLIIDDCGNDRSFMHSPVMRDIASNGRHYGMDILILAQYLNQLASQNRDQLDYVGVLQTPNSKNIEKIYNEYVSEFICPKKTWNYLLGACTHQRGSMCWIDNANPANTTLQSRVFYKHMPWPMKWKQVGNRRIRRYGRRHYIDKMKASTNPGGSTGMIRGALVNGDTSSQYSGATNDSVVGIHRKHPNAWNKIQQRRFTFKDKKGPVYNIFKLPKKTPERKEPEPAVSGYGGEVRSSHYRPSSGYRQGDVRTGDLRGDYRGDHLGDYRGDHGSWTRYRHGDRQGNESSLRRRKLHFD